MDLTLKLIVLLGAILRCNGASLREQLAHIAQRRQENAGIDFVNTRRYNTPGNVILGSPSFPSHLPEAEPILPGHTLLRPALGMLKSAVKFPHRDMENGAGVYGNTDNLGIRWDSRNERLSYSGFRRMPTDLNETEDVPPLRKFTKPNGHKKKPVYLNKNLMLIAESSKNADFEGDELARFILDTWLYQPLHGKSTQNIARTISSRVYSSAKTLFYAKKLLQKLQSNRRQKSPGIIVIKPSNDEGSELQQSSEVTDTPTNENFKWFWNSKDSFNHVKFNPDAPDHEDYLPNDPADKNDGRIWWYYHQADFKPFTVLDK